MIEEVQQRIAAGYCYLCVTDNFQHKELCSNNPSRPKALAASQINVGQIYRYQAAPRSIVAPYEGVVKVESIQGSSRGPVFYLWLQDGDKWLCEEKNIPYVCVTLADVEFFAMPQTASAV